jgi:hypothetical protein
MAKHTVIVCCWEHGHETELVMTRRQEERLAEQLKKLKAVCPVCRNAENGNQPIFIKEGETLFNPSKIYRCRHGHITTIGAFQNGHLHVRYGNGPEEFVNIECTLEELPDLVDTKDVSCHHIGDADKECDCKLKEVDDFELSVPRAAGIKTITRVGDLWDKAGIEPVRDGKYDGDGNYRATRTEKANRHRLAAKRKRLMDEDKHPGKRMTKTSKKKYTRRRKSDLDMGS